VKISSRRLSAGKSVERTFGPIGQASAQHRVQDEGGIAEPESLVRERSGKYVTGRMQNQGPQGGIVKGSNAPDRNF